MKRIEYTIGEDILTIIRSTLYESLKGRFDFEGPEPNKKAVIETGLAGIMQINNAIKEDSLKSGLVINDTTTAKIEGVTHGYSNITIPFLANITFVVNPVLDAGDGEYVNGWQLTSYTYKIIEEEQEPIEIVATGIREPRGPIKYYWVNWLVNSRAGAQYEQRVMTEHPFYAKSNYSITVGSVESNQDKQYSLSTWKEITKEEYELFNKLQK